MSGKRVSKGQLCLDRLEQYFAEQTSEKEFFHPDPTINSLAHNKKDALKNAAVTRIWFLYHESSLLKILHLILTSVSIISHRSLTGGSPWSTSSHSSGASGAGTTRGCRKAGTSRCCRSVAMTVRVFLARVAASDCAATPARKPLCEQRFMAGRVCDQTMLQSSVTNRM